MSDLTDWLGAVSAIASAAAAGIALAVSKKANATAETVARIERDRWRHDMTPVFRARVRALGAGTNKASLVLLLEGPTALDQLDSVTVEIRDDGVDHLPSEQVSAEQIAATVWGPYRFQPGIDGASADGRCVPGRPLAVGAWRKLGLERTPVPEWADGDMWHQTYADHPVRLRVTCKRDGQEPWTVPLTVSVDTP